jgi:arylsulfatase A-like enzyme
MRAASLLLVLVLAKVAVLAGHHVPLSWWSPIAYLWQDALVVLLFAVIEALLGARRRVARVIYAVLVLYIEINIPVGRALSTPLTWSMWRAARGALADSIWHYVNWQNILWLTTVSIVAALAPLCCRRAPQKPLLATLALLVALGPSAAARVDTLGLERNGWTALLGTALPLLGSRAAAGDWHATGFDRTQYEDLSRFHAAAAGRNIVLVSLESTAAQYLGLYGADPDVMPNLSDLGRAGIAFENAYAVYPESIKGLFSILCSIYPAFDSAAKMYASVPCRSIAAILSDNGYRTALFHSGRFMYLGMDAIIRDRGYDLLADAGDIGGHHDSSFGVDEPSTVSRILAWIDALPMGQPFFATYLPIAGHHPYETPEPGPFPERDDFGRYRNALHYGDAALGTLMHGLRARGLDRNTLWIVLGDHGEAFGQHEGNYGHTFFLYDENVHVPFLVAAPGIVPHPIRSRQVVSLIDVAPTLLDLAGLPVPEVYEGRSMFETGPRMALFFADYSLGLLGLRDGPLKFIYEMGSERSRVFDIAADPDEKIDRRARYAEEARWYRRDLRSWMASQKRLLAVSARRTASK